MKELIKTTLAQVNFAEKYAGICNSFNEYNKGLEFAHKEVELILLSLGEKFTSVSKEKSMYKDYAFGAYSATMTITWNYGFVECFYTFWNTDSQMRVAGRFNTMATLQDESFGNRVTYNFPIATSVEDLESILKGLVKLNIEVIERSEKNL